MTTVYVLSFSLSLYNPDYDSLHGLNHVAVINLLTHNKASVVFGVTTLLMYFEIGLITGYWG
jgi:hypothetical protein